MSTDNILRTYGDVSAVDDVVRDSIEIISARDEQIYMKIGRSVALNTIHAYLTDTLMTAGSLAVGEGEAYTSTALTTPSRLTNIVEIVAKQFEVTRTQQDILHYQGENELARQSKKALMDWANAAEYDLVRASLTSGVSGTAPVMSGIIQATSLANNHTSQNSGVVWSSSILDSYMMNSWSTSNGDVPTELYVGAILRKNTDLFTQKSNIVVNAQLPDIMKTVSRYTTAFATLGLNTHRWLQVSGDATGRVLAINPEKLKLAVLRSPYMDDGLARTGDFDVRAIVGKHTLEVRNQNSHFFSDGFLLA